MVLSKVEARSELIIMAGYYTYLVSSLPMLHFAMKPPFSFELFLGICIGIISESDIDILRATSSIEASGYEKASPILKRWRVFDTGLRNELVKIRAARKRIDPLKYVRFGGYTNPSSAHIALHAHRAPSILEAEKILDRERWRFLDELSIGHYFDIDYLLVYATKLLILERWNRINTADVPIMIENVVKQN